MTEPLPVDVLDEQRALALDLDHVVQLARHCLTAESASSGVSIVFVDDTAMTELHGRYLDDPTPTDVMTFPLDEPDELAGIEVADESDDDDELAPPASESRLGEIVISTETAIRQAPDNRGDSVVECLEYVVHGILHLVGYDDVEELDARRMHARQAELLDEWLDTR